jgi:membrane-bound lytic murein transglycosylase B
MKFFCFLCLLLFLFLIATDTIADVKDIKRQASLEDWQNWVAQLKKEAVADGISPNVFDKLFSGLQPDRKVMHLDHTQPEKRLKFLDYRRTRIDAYRITLGVKEYKRHRALLENIGNHFGVNPCFIVALWGIETSYGHFMGNFPVIRSLATLSFDDRRSQLFRKELLIALHIINEGHVGNQDFKGEWAGASGQPQFLPSSWKIYAVDYDHDGRKDIWRSYADSFASIANYLVQHGWEREQPWGIEINLPKNVLTDAKLENVKPVESWLAMGVRPVYGALTPDAHLPASIVNFYGGPNYMVFKNFHALLGYNNSLFYAGSVGYLADQICKRIETPDVMKLSSSSSLRAKR